ncbi:ABC transporter substrate-binding protein [Rhodoferax sp. AJA081-3]|uniref:ABC transporter substrate-binding protein n=1 Tax=Rhodoferax sp. AJA081-3 TaxID=2752316 RepID=UPI001ADF21A9|nr:ABC transporter substrate-binding protein [Rhodoferax sp. AJA081-3]QTN26635.1 ABC transporter substrate-binding protein [Rhodoferax sp. AJA081-3]
MFTHQLWTTRLLTASALCLAALAAPAQTANTLKVGVIGPFTGPSSDFGVQMLQGIQLATEEINAVGGYMGRPFELVIKDDQGTPDAGLKGSQELAAAGVVATLGFCNTGVAQKSLEVFQTAKLPLIIPCATGSPLTAKYPAPESYIFRTSARDAIQAPYVVEDIIRRGWSRVAIFADTTGYGDAGLKDVEAALAAKKLKAVHVARFALGVKDLREELKAARDAGADVVFSYTVGVENAVIANGRKDLNWKVPQVGAWPLSFPFFINGAKDAAEGAMMAQTFIAEPSNERRAAFLSAYKRKFKQALTVPMAAAQGYDSVYLLAFSLFGVRDGNPTGPVVKAALENISRVYYGVVATYERPFSLNDKDAITSNMLVMGRVNNGLVTFARNEDAKQNAVVKRKK